MQNIATRIALSIIIIMFVFLVKARELRAQSVSSSHTNYITQLDTKKEHILPFIMDDQYGRIPIVSVCINGSKPLYFIFDTGSTSTSTGCMCIEPWAAKELKLTAQAGFDDREPSLSKETYTTSLRKVEWVEENKQLFNANCTSALVFRVAKLSHIAAPHRVAGILCAEMFKNMTVRFNFASKIISLFPYNHKPIHTPDGVNISLRRDSDFPVLLLAKLKLDNFVTTDFMVDTGSAYLEILPQVAFLVPNLQISRDVSSAVSIKGEENVISVLLPSIDIGTISEPSVLGKVNNISNYCLLGVNFLSRFIVTIDYPNNILTLQRAPNYAQVASLNGSVGFDVGEQNSKAIAKKVDGDYPAYSLGVRPGDVILAVDGVSVINKKIDFIQKLLRGKVESTVKVVFQRKEDKPYSVTITRKSTYVSSDREAGLGLDVNTQEVNGLLTKVIVYNVVPGSSSNKGGLLPNDEIIAVNSVSIIGMPPSELGNLIKESRNKEIVFTVKRVLYSLPIDIHIVTSNSRLRDLFMNK